MTRLGLSGLGLLGAVLVCPPGPARASNAIQVTSGAALAGSTFGLEIRLDDPGLVAPRDAFVAIGPEKGLRNEASLEVEFTLDCSRLTVAPDPVAAVPLRFLRLAQSTAPSGIRLVVFLESDPQLGWLIGAESWDDASGQSVIVGRAPLFPPGQAPAPVRVEIAWAAASVGPGEAGSLRLVRTEPDGNPTPLVRSRGLRNALQTIEHVQIGVLRTEHPPGLSGQLLLDDFALYRGASHRPGPARRRIEIPLPDTTASPD